MLFCVLGGCIIGVHQTGFGSWDDVHSRRPRSWPIHRTANTDPAGVHCPGAWRSQTPEDINIKRAQARHWPGPIIHTHPGKARTGTGHDGGPCKQPIRRESHRTHPARVRFVCKAYVAIGTVLENGRESCSQLAQHYPSPSHSSSECSSVSRRPSPTPPTSQPPPAPPTPSATATTLS